MDGDEAVNASKIIELSDRPAPEGSAEIFEAFDGLAAGQAIEVVSDCDPRPFLELFRERLAGRFDWWPLEEGPALWRVVVVRRDNHVARTIADFLEADHRRLREVWNDCRHGVHVCDLTRIRARSAEFALGLRRHIRMEEQILFPALEQRTGMQGMGPTAVMRMEHREIENVLEWLSVIGEAENCATIKQTAEGRLDSASALFENHDFKEEKILYPMADRMLKSDEVGQLLLKMQAS